MTFEEFEKLAMNPPKADGETVFVVTEVDMGYLPDHRKNRYPRFKVYRRVIGYCDTLEAAESLMRQAISQSDDIDDIYCFHINEHLVNVYEHGCSDGISGRLYSHDGNLIDRTWLDSSCSGEQLCLKFRGRPKSSIRFKAGDIVEVLKGDEVHLAIATHSPVDIEWCRNLRNRIAKRLSNDGCVPVEIDEREYILDDCDDQAAVIDGPGYEYHEHIPTLNIMPLRFPLSSRLRKRYEGFLQSCLRQNEQYEQNKTK